MASPNYDIVGIGNAIVDVICQCSEEFIVQHDLPKGQMRLVESSAIIFEILKKLRRPIDVAGGSVANTTVGVASLGGRAAFIGKVAEDQFGRSFRHDIQGVGVAFDTPPTSVVGKQTSHSLILVSPDGCRTMSTFLGCSTELGIPLINPATIRAGRVVYVEGYLFDSSTATAACKHAIDIAKSAGRTVAMALSDARCVDRNRPEMMSVIRLGVDVLIANEAELMSLYQTNSLDDGILKVGRDVRLAVVTRSALGSTIISQGNSIVVPPEGVSRVIDATGAGDLYAAGFLFGLARGMDLFSAGRLGSFAAAEIICQLGARPVARLESMARMRGMFDKQASGANDG